jgi:hypothetical protein
MLPDAQYRAGRQRHLRHPFFPGAGRNASAAPPAGGADAGDGIAVPPALWWELHHLSNTSLSPDTPESRRHAGPDDGRIIGRSDHDDDTDISMLTSSGKV